MIGGFELPTKGKIYLGNEDITYLPPNKRDTATVFQSYGLFPHMNVFDNVAYGLKLRKLPSKQIKDKVMNTLDLVGLKDLAQRAPSKLSGGQQQRVALGRALVRNPQVFLMDEPLSNLDARLRMDMRGELKRLHRLAGATTIYVTHDQVEALTMSTSIAVMKEGVLQQVDAPDAVYRTPANLFVADFVGNPKINLLRGRVAGEGVVDLGHFRVEMPTHGASGEVVVAVRPEDVAISREPVAGAPEFVAYSVLPAGADTTIVAHHNGLEITAKEAGISDIAMDDRVWLTFRTEMLNLYDADSGNLIAPS